MVVHDEGGDAACWLDSVCDRCGSLIDKAEPHRCGSLIVEDGVMEYVSSDVFEDPTYSVPVAPFVPGGVGWLRGTVARFSEGDAHRRRRALVVSVIDQVESRHL